ncbi:hypothetical protein BDQ17DRAFT_1359931, partial [Cyathus striatus]
MLPQGRRRNLTAEDVFFLHGEVNCTSLGIMCSADVSIPTIWHTLRNGGFHMKKLTRNAMERSTMKCARYTLKIATQYTSEHAADCHTTYQGYAWAIKGSKAVRKAFFVCGK